MNLYDKSSLILVPSGVKASKVYSQRPENGDGDFTFSRASVANRINKDGLIEQVASNVPRLDYTDSSCPSLLLEPQRTNEVFYSQNINNNGLSKVGTSIITENIISPAGLTSVSLLKENSANNSHFAYKDWPLANPAPYAISIFAKSKGENRNFRFGDGGLGWSSGFIGDFNLTNGTASGGTIEDYGNGWYRCSVQGTTSAAVSRLIMYSTLGTATTYQGDNVSGVYLYGFQIEQGAYTTSLINTNGPIATRNSDGGLTTIGSFSDVFGSSSLTQYAIFISLNKATQAQAGSATLIPLGTNAQGRINYAGGNRIAYYSTATGYATESFVTDGNPHKYLLVANNGSIKQFFDGLFVDEVNNPSDEFVSFSFLGASGNYADFDLGSIIVFSKSLTDEEAIALTTL